MHSADNRTVEHHATPALAEADRLMVVCNSCRYCEGLCAVFPAMELRRSFADGDLNYLANLCHNCGACYDDCQFSPPHEFNVNVPQTLAKVRHQSYQAYVWPGAFAGVFERNGLAIALIAAGSVAAFLIGCFASGGAAEMFASHAGPGAFYRLIPHNALAAIFGFAFVYALVAIAIGVVRFWRDARGEDAPPLGLPGLWQAMKDAGSLRYLDGGGGGCDTPGDAPDSRKHYHHLTFYGFMLCFAATSVATLYHYLLGREAPYAWYDLPVVLGTLGGIGIVAGPIGLLRAKRRRDPALGDPSAKGMELAFLYMLFATGLTGIALLVLRDTAAMASLLAVHLGVVFALFITMPYGKFVHGFYRFVALVAYAAESTDHA